MTVETILKSKGRTVVTMRAQQGLAEAAELLARHRIGAVVVQGAGGRVAGVLSERDVVRAIAERGAQALNDPISAYMTERVVTCAPLDSVDELMEAMTHGRFRHLPVVEDDRLLGIVSIGDVVKLKIAQAEREVVAMREYIATG